MSFTNSRMDKISRRWGKNTAVPRDEYGNTANDIAREKLQIAKFMGQPVVTPTDNRYAGLGIPDAVANVHEQSAVSPVDISDSYASRHRAERLGKLNIVDATNKGSVSDTQYLNPNPRVNREDPTTWLGEVANDIDNGYDDVMDYIFGKSKPEGNKKEQEEAFRADQNLEVNEDGNIVDSRQATLNDESISTLRSELMNAEEDPDADQLIYYARIDNPDGSSSYKIGLAGVDTFGRTAEEDRGKDITYLWTKRTKDAAKYEALFHGNRDLLKTRRNDIGTDVENYGAGHTEIYNTDFLQLDGSVSSDKVRTLNMSTVSKMAELGVEVSGRYDDRGMRLAYKELEKKESLYGHNSPEAQEMRELVGNLEQEGKQKQGLISHAIDTTKAFASGAQQTLAGAGDWVLDAVTPGNNSILDNLKDPEVADKFWGYRGRKEANARGRQALEKFHAGDYVDSLLLAVSAGPDLVAQSLPDMAEMALDVLAIAGSGGGAIGLVAAKRAAKIALKAAIKDGSVAATRTAQKAFLKEFKRSGAWKDAAKKGVEARKDMSIMKKVMSGDTYKALAPFTLDKGNKSRVALGATAGTAAWAARYTNNQIDERIKNNDGEEVGYPEIATMWTTNFFSGLLEKAALKETVSSQAMKMLGGASEVVKRNVVLKGLHKAVGLVEGGAVEAGQEYIQEYIEALNEGLGTKAFGYTNDIFHEEFQHRAELGAILGFGAGVTQHGGVSAIKGVVGANRERKRNNVMDEATDFFGNKRNDADNELNTEDSRSNLSSSSYFKGLGIAMANADEEYEIFKKNLKSNESPEQGIRSVVKDIVGLYYGLGSQDRVVKSINNILNGAEKSGDISPELRTELADETLAKLKDFDAKTIEYFSPANTDSAVRDEVVNMINSADATNIDKIATNLAQHMIAEEMDNDKVEAVILKLKGDATHNSNLEEVVSKLEEMLTASNNESTKKQQEEDGKEEETEDDEDDVDYSSEGSKEEFEYVEANTPQENVPLTRTLEEAANLAKHSKSKMSKIKTISKAITQFNSLARGIAAKRGDTTADTVNKIAVDLMNTFIFGDLEKIKDSATFKVLSRELFGTDNIDASGPLGIFTALENVPQGVLTNIQKMQENIIKGYKSSIKIQRKPETDDTTSSITTTAKEVYLAVKGSNSSLQSHLNTFLSAVGNKHTTASTLRSLKEKALGSLEAFAATKNTQNTNGSLTEELQDVADEELVAIENFRVAIKEAYEGAIEERINPSDKNDIRPNVDLETKEDTTSTEGTTEDTTEETEETPPVEEEPITDEAVDEVYDPIVESYENAAETKAEKAIERLETTLEENSNIPPHELEKAVSKAAGSISKMFTPITSFTGVDIPANIITMVNNAVKAIKGQEFFNTEGAKLVHYYLSKASKELSIQYRSALEVVAVGTSTSERTNVMLSLKRLQANLGGKDIKHQKDFLQLVANMEKALADMQMAEGTTVKHADNPLLYLALDKDGKIPKEFHSAIMKGFLEAIDNFDNNLNTTPKEEDVSGDKTKIIAARENLGMEVDTDTLEIDGGIATDRFSNYMAKAIARELIIAVGNTSLTAEISGMKGKTTLTDNTKEEAAEGISTSLAAYVVSGFIKNKVLLQETKIGKNAFVHFLTVGESEVVQKSVRSKVKGLSSVYDLLTDKKFLRQPENSGLVFDVKKLPKRQTKLDKTGDALSKSSIEHVEKVRNTKWYASDLLTNTAKYSTKELFQLLGLELKEIKPSYLLNHTDMTAELLYEEIMGKKPSQSIAEDTLILSLEVEYRKYMNTVRGETSFSTPTREGRVLENVMIVKAMKAYNDTGGKILHFDASIGGNGRIYIQGLGLLSPQAHKTLRGLVTSEVTSNIVIGTADSTNNIELREFKSQIAEALSKFVKMPKEQKKIEEAKVDYNKIELAVTQFAHLKVPQALLDMVMALHDGDISKKTFLDNVKKEDNMKVLGMTIDLADGSTFPALYSYAKYKEASNKKEKYFTSSMTMGQDGKSSVVFHLAMMEGAIAEVWGFLTSTGVLTSYAKDKLIDNPKYKHLKREIEAANDVADLKKLDIELLDGYEQAIANFTREANEVVDSMNTLVGEKNALVEIDGTNITVSKAGRNFAKDPQMTGLYGIQRTSSSENTGLAFIEIIRERVMDYRNKGKKDDTLREDLSKGLIDFSSALYSTYSSSNKKEAAKELTTTEINKFIKDVFNTDNNTAEDIDKFLYTRLKKIADQAIGDALFETLADTNAPLTKDSKLLNATGIASTFVAKLAESIVAELNANNTDVSPMFYSYQQYIKELLDPIIYKFGIGQKISAVKRVANDETTGTANLAVPDLASIKATAKKTVKKVEFVIESNTGSPAVGTIHELDKETAAVLSDLGLMQVYDSIYTFPGGRAFAGGLANLAAAMNTIVHGNRYAPALAHLREVKKELKKIQKNEHINSFVLDGAVGKVIGGSNFDLSILAKTLGIDSDIENLGGFMSAIDSLIEELVQADLRQVKNMQEKKQVLGNLAQYASEGAVIFDSETQMVQGIALNNGKEFLFSTAIDLNQDNAALEIAFKAAMAEVVEESGVLDDAYTNGNSLNAAEVSKARSAIGHLLDDDKVKQELVDYLANLKFSTELAVKKATIHFILKHPAIDTATKQSMVELLMPDLVGHNTAQPATLEDFVEQELFDDVLAAYETEQKIQAEREAVANAYQPSESALAVSPEAYTIIKEIDSYKNLPLWVAKEMLEAIHKLKEFVTLDTEYTYNVPGHPQTIMELAVKESGNETAESLHHMPTFYRTFLDNIKGIEVHAEYFNVFSSDSYKADLEKKSNPQTEDELATAIFDKLNKLTKGATIPIVAYNGLKADLPRLAELARRTGNNDLRVLVNSLTVIDPFVIAYHVNNVAMSKGQHTQGNLIKILVGEDKNDNTIAHRGVDDVTNLEKLVVAIRKKVSAKDLTFREEETSAESRTEKPVPPKATTESTTTEGGEVSSALLAAMGNSSAESQAIFDSDGNILPPRNPADKAIDDFTETLTNENAYGHLERLITYDNMENEESDFLRSVFTNLIAPFYEDPIEILYIERKGKRDTTASHGKAEKDRFHRGRIRLITRAGGFGKSKQSSAEVFVHEHIHVIVDRLFGSKELQTRYHEELKYLESIYNEAKGKADPSWFSTGSQSTFDYVFNNKSETRGMKEFYAYAFADHVFAKHIAEEIGNPILKATPGIDTTNVITLITSTIKKMLHWLIKTGNPKRNKNAHELLLDIAYTINGITPESKNIVAKALNKATDKIYEMDLHMKHATRGIGKVYDDTIQPALGQIDPTSVIGGFLQDVLPSSSYLNKYYKIATKAYNDVGKAREDMIIKTSNLVLGIGEDNKPTIEQSEDTMLYDIALKFDLKSLYNLFSGKKEYRTIGIVRMLGDVDSKIADLESKIDDSHLPALKIAAGALHRRAIGTSSLTDSETGISDVTELMKINGMIDTEQNYRNTDALITLYALQTFVKNKEHAEYMKTFLEAMKKQTFVESLSNTLDMDADIQEKVRDIRKHSKIDSHYNIKGSTHKVTDNNTRLVPRIISAKVTEEANKLGRELVHTVDILGTKVQIGIYKVESSTTQNRDPGLVDITDIEYSDVTTVRQLLVAAGVNNTNITRIMKKTIINRKSQFFSTIKTDDKLVTDFSFTIPSFLEDKYLDVDNRASTSLGHKRGAIETFEQAKATNLGWVNLAAEDAATNRAMHPKDFVWIGEGASTKDLVMQYRILPRYMKNAIKKKASLSSRKQEGMWVRKEALTLSLGAEGASLMDLLEFYGIRRKDVNYVIRKIENFLPILGAIYKNEIVRKTLEVVGGNMSSNILLELLKGRNNPREVITLMIKNMMELKSINKKQQQISAYKVKLRTIKDTSNAKYKSMTKDMDKLTAEVEDSYLYYLVKEGFNDNFFDDVNNKESQYMGKTAKAIYRFSEKHPVGRKAFDIVYINRGTKLNSVISDVFLLSDIAAMATSDILDKKYLEKEIKTDFNLHWKRVGGGRSSSEKALSFKRYRSKAIRIYDDNRYRRLQELTIAYGVVTGGKVASYLDKNMVLPFYKYKLRIKRVFAHRLQERGLSTIANVISQNLLDIAVTGDYIGLESAQESLFDMMSYSSFRVGENAYAGMTPAMADIVDKWLL